MGPQPSSHRTARGRAAERRGRRAEWLCVLRLILTGWRILGRRVSGPRGSGIGEIDLVARRGRTVAFIEVKARDDTGDALESVRAAQQARLVRAAESFMARHPALINCTIRFDVMTVGSWPWPRHYGDAWRP